MGVLRDSGSFIEIVNDLSTPVDDWIFEKVVTPNRRRQCIAIGFIRGDEKRVVFNDLSFGFKLYDSTGTVVIEREYPRDDGGIEQYIAVNTNGDKILDENEIISIDDVNILAYKNYKIDVWTKESGIFSEGSFEFSFPAPYDKPYDSWVWNEKTNGWISPIGAHPTTGDFATYVAVWDEDNKKWTVDKSKLIVTAEMMQGVAGVEGVESPDYDLE